MAEMRLDVDWLNMGDLGLACVRQREMAFTIRYRSMPSLRLCYKSWSVPASAC